MYVLPTAARRQVCGTGLKNTFASRCRAWSSASDCTATSELFAIPDTGHKRASGKFGRQRIWGFWASGLALVAAFLPLTSSGYCARLTQFVLQL